MMHIAFCTDTNYVMPCGVAMTSICDNNKGQEITFHLVITDEGTASDEVETKVTPLRDIAEEYEKRVEVYRMDANIIRQFSCSGVASYISCSAFTRVFLPQIISKEIKRIIYFDCDIVCEGEIKSLWDTPLDCATPLGAVVESSYARPEHYLRSNITFDSYYVNSGVLLFNLDCWRNNDYSAKIIEAARKYKFPLLDQDSINHVLHGMIKYLPYKYNYQLITAFHGVDNSYITLDNYYDIKSAAAKPIIIHYSLANKPWKLCMCPNRDIWEKYLRLTIWKDFVPKDSIITRFDRTMQREDFEDSYWSDPNLFVQFIPSYLNFFRQSVKFKNKKVFLVIVSKILNLLSLTLDKIYKIKISKNI